MYDLRSMYRASLSLSLPLVLAVIASVALEGAQLSEPSPPASGSTADRLQLFDGPPAPLAPQVATRDDEGRVTIRAVPLTGRIQIDGRLDEAIYAATPADFRFHPDRAAAPARPRPRRRRCG